MSLSLDQVTQLITQLYAASPVEMAAADRALKQWQQSSGAWEVCLAGLATQTQSDSVQYFYAQTLRVKIQLDFCEVPATVGLQLKQTVLQLVLGSSAISAPTRTQLLLSLCDLAIHLCPEHWPSALDELTGQGQWSMSPRNVLDILRFLPEELENVRLLVDSVKRTQFRQFLVPKFPVVLAVLEAVLAAGPSVGRESVAGCLAVWLHLCAPSQESLLASALFRSLIGDSGLILEVLQSGPEAYPLVVKDMILPHLLALDLGLTTDASDEELLATSRMMTLCCEALFETFSSGNASERITAVDLLRLKVLPLLAFRPTDPDFCPVLLGPLELLQDLAFDLGSVDPGPGPRSAPEVLAVMAQALDAVVARLAGLDADPAAVQLELQRQLLATTRALLKLLGVRQLGDQLLALYGQSLAVRGGSSTQTEALTRVMIELVELGYEIDSPTTKTQLIDALLAGLAVEPFFGGHGRLAEASIELIGLLVSSSADYHLIEKTLQTLAAAVGAAGNMGRVVVQSIGKIASRNRQKIAAEKREYITGLTSIVGRIPQSDYTSQSILIEAIISVLNYVPDDQFFNTQLTSTLEPLLSRINAAAPTVEDLDLITCICRSLKLKKSDRVDFFKSVIAPVIWRSIETGLVASRGKEAAVEKCCRVIKHLIRVDVKTLAFLIPDISARIRSEFALNPLFSSYLYVAEILIDAYGDNQQTPPELVALFDALAAVAIATLTAPGEREAAQIDLLLEDLFGMCTRYLKYAGPAIANSPRIGQLLAVACRALESAERRETFDSLFSFLTLFFDAAGAAAATAAPAAVTGVVRMVVRQFGREDVLVMVPRLLEALFRSAQPAQDLLAAILDQELPRGIVNSPQEKALVIADLLSDDHASCINRLCEIGKKCQQKVRRT